MRRLSNEAANKLLETYGAVAEAAATRSLASLDPEYLDFSTLISGLHLNLWVGVEILHRMEESSEVGKDPGYDPAL